MKELTQMQANIEINRLKQVIAVKERNEQVIEEFLKHLIEANKQMLNIIQGNPILEPTPSEFFINEIGEKIEKFYAKKNQSEN